MPVGVLKLSMQVDMEKLLHQAAEVLLTTAHAPTKQLNSEILCQYLFCGRTYCEVHDKSSRLLRLIHASVSGLSFCKFLMANYLVYRIGFLACVFAKVPLVVT